MTKGKKKEKKKNVFPCYQTQLLFKIIISYMHKHFCTHYIYIPHHFVRMVWMEPASYEGREHATSDVAESPYMLPVHILHQVQTVNHHIQHFIQTLFANLHTAM